jgi:nitronate monooxygenase
MALPPILRDRLRLPVIASPLFIISNPDLVIAQCKAGIVGSFPSLNARPISQLDEWLHRITEELAAHDRAHPEALSAPFAVNQIVHKTNNRLEEDIELCVKHKVPVVITSLGAREDLNGAIHSYGGITLHDVINDRHAHKAIEKGADGLIPVAAGAGGHAGVLSPFALIQEIRQWFDGPVALSGSIASGRSILAAQAMGADLAYIGSAFIATEEANAIEGYKQGIVEGRADGHRLFEPVHRRARQLPALVDRQCGPRSRKPAGQRPVQDELRLGRQHRRQGLARHLGFGPGHRRDRPGAAGRRTHRQIRGGVRASQGRTGGQNGADVRKSFGFRRRIGGWSTGTEQPPSPAFAAT